MKNLGHLLGRLSERSDRGAIGPIGLHLADEKMHAVQLRRVASGGLCLRAFASLDYGGSRGEMLTNPALAKSRLRALLKSAGFRGRRIVTAMPPHQLNIMPLSYQADSPEQEPARIVELLAERIDGSLAEYVVDYLPVRGAEGERERVALVATAKRAEVVALLDLLDHCGLEAEALDVGPAALHRVVTAMARHGFNSNVLLLNVGTEHGYLTIISGRRLLMDKEVRFSEKMLLDRVRKALEMPEALVREMLCRDGLVQQQFDGAPADTMEMADRQNPLPDLLRPAFRQLADNIRRATLYASAESQGNQIERIYMFGSVARWPGACEFLQDIANLPVSDTLPLTAIFDGDEAEDYNGVGPELAIATGLALRGLVDHEER